MLDLIASFIFFGFCFIFVMAVIETIADYMRTDKTRTISGKTRLSLLRFFKA